MKPRILVTALLMAFSPLCADAERGTGDLGIVVERAAGSLLLIETSGNSKLARIEGLGDLSHASAVFSRDGRYAFVFGRDGGLSKVDLLQARLVKRVMQAGNSIGGAISQDGRLVAVSNYEPGGVRIFDAETLDLVADIPAVYGPEGKTSKVIGLVDAPGNRFVFSLWDAGEIWIADMKNREHAGIHKLTDIGHNPYDALITPDGRFYIPGGRCAPRPPGLREGRGEASSLQDAAPGGLGGGRPARLPPGGGPA
jgi:protein NirF